MQISLGPLQTQFAGSSSILSPLFEPTSYDVLGYAKLGVLTSHGHFCSVIYLLSGEAGTIVVYHPTLNELKRAVKSRFMDP